MGPISTMRPRYMTATRSAIVQANPRSCVTTRIVRPRRSRRSISKRQDLPAHRGVQVGHGLVRDDEVGLQRERARDDDALALPARQFVRVAQEEPLGRAQPRVGQRLRDLIAFLAAHLVDPQALGDRLVDRLARVERPRGVLEDHLDPATVRAQVLPDGLAQIRDLTLLRALEAHDGPRRGGLAAAGLAGQCQDLALLQLQADAVDRARHGGLLAEQAGSQSQPSGEGDVDVGDVQDGCRHGGRGGHGLGGVAHGTPGSVVAGPPTATPSAASAPSTCRQAARRPCETS